MVNLCLLINQKFKVRKDIRRWIVYFEDDGPVEMSGISAFITSLIGENKSREELIEEVKKKYPNQNSAQEVDKVLKTLQEMNLLS